MNQFKFRLWERELKAVITPENSDQFLISLDGRVFDAGFTFSNQAEYCKDMVVMQFTGLKDKNGVDIYEGDIAKTDKGNFKVSYDYIGFTVDGYDNGDFYQGSNPEFHDWESFEVIGNIHENPELLP